MRRDILIAIGLALFVVTMYLASPGVEPLRPIGFHTYSAQAEALLDGRLYLRAVPPNSEVAIFDDRIYVAGPPGPALVFVPFVRIFGPHFNPQLLHILLSGGSVALIYLLLRQRQTPWISAVVTGIGFAFGTALWWTTKRAEFWFSAHVVAVFFLCLSLYLSSSRLMKSTGFALGIAILSRQVTLFALPFVLYSVKKNEPQQFWRRTFHLLLGLSAPAIFFLCINYLRFGNPLEGGYNHLFLRSPGLEKFQAYGQFNLHYLPENLYTLLFAGLDFITEFPHLRPKYFGLSIFLSAPILLLAFWSRVPRQEALLLWTGILAMLGVHLLYFNNGYAQFGYRFALDFTPLLILLIGSSVASLRSKAVPVVIGASILVNTFGVLTLP